MTQNPTPGYTLKRTESRSQRPICTTMVIAALFVIVKRQKEPKCPAREEWVKEKTQWTITQSEKGREPLPQAITWTNPEDMMLREISQLQEDKSYFDSTYMGYLK